MRPVIVWVCRIALPAVPPSAVGIDLECRRASAGRAFGRRFVIASAIGDLITSR